jgi:hypothetical protein
MQKLLKLASLFKNAATFPGKGDKVMAEVVQVSEEDGVRKYILKFDSDLGEETRALFFFEKQAGSED